MELINNRDKKKFGEDGVETEMDLNEHNHEVYKKLFRIFEERCFVKYLL